MRFIASRDAPDGSKDFPTASTTRRTDMDNVVQISGHLKYWRSEMTRASLSANEMILPGAKMAQFEFFDADRCPAFHVRTKDVVSYRVLPRTYRQPEPLHLPQRRALLSPVLAHDEQDCQSPGLRALSYMP